MGRQYTGLPTSTLLLHHALPSISLSPRGIASTSPLIWTTTHSQSQRHKAVDWQPVADRPSELASSVPSDIFGIFVVPSPRFASQASNRRAQSPGEQALHRWGRVRLHLSWIRVCLLDQWSPPLTSHVIPLPRGQRSFSPLCFLTFSKGNLLSPIYKLEEAHWLSFSYFMKCQAIQCSPLKWLGTPWAFNFLFSENQPVELTPFFSISYIENSMAFSHRGARTKTVPFCNFISIGNANTKGVGEFEILLALMHVPLLSVVKSLALTLSSYGRRN